MTHKYSNRISINKKKVPIKLLSIGILLFLFGVFLYGLGGKAWFPLAMLFMAAGMLIIWIILLRDITIISRGFLKSEGNFENA